MGQEGPGWAQDGPKKAQDGTKRALRGAKMGQDGPRSRRGETLTFTQSGALVEAKRSFLYFGKLWFSKVVLSSRRNARFHISSFF